MLGRMTPALAESEIYQIERPSPKLMQYYFLCSILAGPFLPLVLIPQFFKYHTMRYRFDAEGISMRWGILFRREVILNYVRIQDIHLSSNILERWLGLARLHIQTASGSAQAEMTIEGLLEYESIRDFLYSRMRGQRAGVGISPKSSALLAPGHGGPAAPEDLLAALKTVTEELRLLRQCFEENGPKNTSDARGVQSHRPADL